MFTAYALVKNLDSRVDELHFQNFIIRKLRAGYRDELEHARSLFPYSRVSFGDWVYEKSYEKPPQVLNSEQDVGLGRIPIETEDALLLFRLFSIGDICFTAQTIRQPDGGLNFQYPYWAMSDIHTILPYRMEQDVCPKWDEFAAEIPTYEGWNSIWFKTARSFFLSGGAKEFNVYWDRLERIVDYMVALEATLSTETDYLRRRLSERAIKLLGLTETNRDEKLRLLKKFYDFRSSIAHGSQVSEKNKDFIKSNRDEFESIVRSILVEAIRSLPSDESQRKSQLSQLFDISDEDRCEKISTDFFRISDTRARYKLLILLIERSMLNH